MKPFSVVVLLLLLLGLLHDMQAAVISSNEVVSDPQRRLVSNLV
jgi:hypothetical protein